MKLDEIKQEAIAAKFHSIEALSDKIGELKNKGVPFLGCVAFVQANQNLTLSEARTMTLSLDCWTEKEMEAISLRYRLMMSEYEEEE